MDKFARMSGARPDVKVRNNIRFYMDSKIQTLEHVIEDTRKELVTYYEREIDVMRHDLAAYYENKVSGVHMDLESYYDGILKMIRTLSETVNTLDARVHSLTAKVDHIENGFSRNEYKTRTLRKSD